MMRRHISGHAAVLTVVLSVDTDGLVNNCSPESSHFSAEQPNKTKPGPGLLCDQGSV